MIPNEVAMCLRDSDITFSPTRMLFSWKLFLSLAFVLGLMLSDHASAQENWSRFHGANGSGLALDADLPTQISDKNFIWNVDLAGTGSSSPVVWGDLVFVNSTDSNTGELTIQCLKSETGEQIWAKSFDSKVYKVHNQNSFASGTPAVDKDHVYLTYANPNQTMVVALTHDGEQKWKRDFGSWISQHGFAASLMTYKDKVIFFNSQQAQKLRPGAKPGASTMIAMSCADGSDVWKTSLTATRCCYAVPGIFTGADGKDQLISCNTGDGFFSLDPDSGDKNWSTLPFEKRTVASTLIADGLIIGSNGSGGGGNYLVAIRPDKEGAKPEKAYELQKANYVPSPVAVGGKLYFFTDKGIGNCADLQTGKIHWQQRISRGFSGSPVATKNHIYIMDESGKLYVIAAKKEYELVSSLELGQESRATPAVAKDRIYLRTQSRLICAGKTQ